MMRIVLMGSLVGLLSACTAGQPSELALKQQATEETRLAKTLEGMTAGPVQSCVQTRDLQGPESYGKTTLLFRKSRNFYYRTETRGSCDSVNKGDALITHQWGTQICRGDIARTADLQSGFQTDVCSFGDFVPYRKRG
jgi:hypothetical protein